MGKQMIQHKVQIKTKRQDQGNLLRDKGQFHHLQEGLLFSQRQPTQCREAAQKWNQETRIMNGLEEKHFLLYRGCLQKAAFHSVFTELFLTSSFFTLRLRPKVQLATNQQSLISGMLGYWKYGLCKGLKRNNLFVAEKRSYSCRYQKKWSGGT